MRKSVFTLFVLWALLFALSFALHAEDLPETPYDESQGVASEHASQFVIQVLQDSAERTRPPQKSGFPALLGSPTRLGEIRAAEREQSGQPDFVTPTVRAVPLRC